MRNRSAEPRTAKCSTRSSGSYSATPTFAARAISRRRARAARSHPRRGRGCAHTAGGRNAQGDGAAERRARHHDPHATTTPTTTPPDTTTAPHRPTPHHHDTITLAGCHLDADHPILVDSEHRVIMVIRTCDPRTDRHRITRNCSGATLPDIDKHLVSRAPDTLWPTETITRSRHRSRNPRSHPRASVMGTAGIPQLTGRCRNTATGRESTRCRVCAHTQPASAQPPSSERSETEHCPFASHQGAANTQRRRRCKSNTE